MAMRKIYNFLIVYFRYTCTPPLNPRAILWLIIPNPLLLFVVITTVLSSLQLTILRDMMNISLLVFVIIFVFWDWNSNKSPLITRSQPMHAQSSPRFHIDEHILKKLRSTRNAKGSARQDQSNGTLLSLRIIHLSKSRIQQISEGNKLSKELKERHKQR